MPLPAIHSLFLSALAAALIAILFFGTAGTRQLRNGRQQLSDPHGHDTRSRRARRKSRAVMDATGLALVNGSCFGTSRALLQYVVESFPYTPASAEQAHALVFELAREGTGRAGPAGPVHASPPRVAAGSGAFPSHYTTINFVSLDHLLPPLLKEQRFAVAELERALAALPESDARTSCGNTWS